MTLLDCWTVAWAIVLTWFFLGTRYSIWQLFGAAICVVGLGLVLLSDAGVGGEGDNFLLLFHVMAMNSFSNCVISSVSLEELLKIRTIYVLVK